ncbi:AVB_G0043220.mRNA.1.CDS.1 [Saccharomyces cerevisiae]|nr:AVB_G0043220.mRNA.1.CDS.1 [Saccharomyces cerevisiae]CAI7253360.1 AVB_G0043220.mRNA.1.CDS.1 [Saccharomyces cerevisiae]
MLPRQSSLVNLAGYGGDVWDKQPGTKRPSLEDYDNKDHVGNAMTVHISGTSLDAQKRYAQGVKNILNSYFSKSLITVHRILIVQNGSYATRAYGQKK